jgi:O-antigen/teichoic acid export membrane protein
MVLGLAVVAPEFISVFLGEKWVVAVRPLQILCAFNAIRVIPILASPVLQIVDEVRFQAITTMVGLAYMPLAFYFGAKAAGAEGVAFAWLVAYPPLLLLIAHRTVRALGLRLIDIPRAIFPSILSGLCMVAVVVTVRGLLAENMSDVIRLFALIACGALAYVLVMFVLFRTRIEEFRRTVSVLRR